ncbi:MAG TPA: AAA family ATPase [Arsenophonus apicola]|uniref:ParA family protein n=1 Tax=Arsenophonus apicola TaxID=2879119 RepID=UPI001CDBEF4C|nr:ParA family protein [Arsenophonus apicola]UBX30639.1 ParA family protein [Arsenophonus apicola]
MKVISLLNPKGGTGKTTATINIATCLSRQKINVAVVDTDPQRSLTNWNKLQKATFDLYTSENEKDVYQVRKELNEYDYIIIDGAGSLSVITSAAVMVSDLVIIPVSPSPLDFSAAGSVIDVLEAQEFSRKVPACFLITRIVNNANMLDVLKLSINSTKYTKLRTGFTSRQSYIKTLINGETIFDSKDMKAIGETEIITQEIINMII